MSDSVRFQHFEVLRKDDGSLFELGRGAMGITYKAFDTNLRCFVALKVINAAYLNSEIARQRFLREARAAAALRHPNVATVFHLGSEDDNYFYAMEFIDGDTVEAFMKREGAIPPPMALEIASQVARALGAAQKQNLVHRDIKPSNLMFVREDGGDEFTVKVIDFGLAKSAATGEDTASLTGGGFLGTPHFASPEQLEERELDVRSDIYSLGVTLWYMLAGKTPFGGSLAQVMSQHLHREPPFETLEGQHPVVLKLLRRMMAKDAGERPQTPAELRKEIEACMEVVKTLGPVQATTAPVSAENFETEMAATIMSEGGPVEPATGVVLAGRYRLLEEATASDHGRMFRAEQIEDKTIVGVLILNTGLLATSQAFTRLEQEVEALQKLRDCAFQKILSLEHADKETFIVVEWVDGPSLLDLLRVRRALTVGESVRILGQLADAFDELRGSGLNCPDIGAHEVMLPGGEPSEPVTSWKVCAPKFTALTATGGNSSSPDATMVASSFAMMKATGAFAGNPPAAYVYAVAALAYEMLGGVRTSGSTSNYVPIPGLSEEGNAALRKALNPAQGYASARALVNELAEEDKGAKPVIVATPPPIPPTVTPPPIPATVAPVGGGKGKSPMKTVLIAGGALLLAFVGVLVIFLGVQKKKPAEVPVVAQSTPMPTPEATPEPTPEATPEPVDPQVEAYQNGLAAADALKREDKVGEALLAYADLVTHFPQEKQPHVEMEKLTALARAQKLSDVDFFAMRPALVAAADLNVMSAQMLLGERLRKTEPAIALRYLMAAADTHNNSEAMVHTGEMLAAGTGVDVPDPVEAVRWFTRATKNLSPSGMYALAECKFFRKGTAEDKKGAVELLFTAAALNQPEAINRLGDLYRRGVPGGILEPNAQEAFKLFTKAQELGFLDAQANIGVMYILGEGVPQDSKKAVELFRDGAEKGNALCMLNYGKCFAMGMGLPKSSASAREWFMKAAGGNRGAVEELIKMANSGDAQAVEWCKKNNIPLAN